MDLTVTERSDFRARRLAAGLTQQRLAQLADCSLSLVALYDSGLTPQRSAIRQRIEVIFNDVAPVASGREVTTSAGVGDGRAEA